MSRYARPILGIRFQWHHRGAYLLWNHRWLPDVYGTENRWLLQILRFGMTKDAQDDNALSRILHSVSVSVYGDKVAASSMTTRGRLRSGRDGGPRTSQICILLKYRLLQNIVVRGPLTEERLCAPLRAPSPSSMRCLRCLY